jgi:hypothetical protein
MVEIQFKRGGRKVLYEGYNYNYKKNAPDKIIWRCRTSGRNFYLRTNLEMAISSVTEHSNEADFEKNLTEFAYRKMLKRSEETSELPREIIYETFKGFNDVEVVFTPFNFSHRSKDI